MSESNRELLSIGAFIVTVVIGILLYATGLIDWTLIAPVVLVIFGAWMLGLASIRGSKPIKYERGAFGTLALGLCLIAAGGAWFLFSINWLYSIVVLLLVVAALAIAASLKRR
jgi:hypothetical protein